MHLHKAIFQPNRDDAQPQPLTQPDIPLERPPPRLTRPTRHGHIDQIADRLPGNGLLQQVSENPAFSSTMTGALSPSRRATTSAVPTSALTS